MVNLVFIHELVDGSEISLVNFFIEPAHKALVFFRKWLHQLAVPFHKGLVVLRKIASESSKEEAMSDFNMADKLWDLANLITSFAVVQTAVTSIAVTKGELSALRGSTAHWIAFLRSAVFSASYIVAIGWCGATGSSLDKAANSQMWSIVTLGRISAVLLFTFVMVGALWGHRHDEFRQIKDPSTP